MHEWPSVLFGDEFVDAPFVESVGFAQVRVLASDPLSDFANRVLERQGAPSRYVAVFMEDGILTEGLYTREGAREEATRVQNDMNEGVIFTPASEEVIEAQLVLTLRSLEPVMSESERAEYDEVMTLYREALRQFREDKNGGV